MNSKICALLIAAILGGAAFAQSSGAEPSDQDALARARAAFQSSPAAAQDQRGTDSGPAAEDRVPYTPVVLAFVPGLQLPFGHFDTSVCVAYIGALTNDINGFAGAGVFDMAADVQGFQASGLFNTAYAVKGFQAAGIFNLARGIEGFQGSGLFNIARNADSAFQGAGIFNIAGNISGAQIAGIFNVARNMRGTQIGLINVADHIDGVQIGLINIARNGVAGLTSMYEPETGYLFGYWQTGTPSLYTVIGAGAPITDWFSTSDRALLSFGLGSRLEHGRFYVDMDVSVEEPIGPALDAGIASGFSEPANPWTTPYPSGRLSVGIPLAGRVHLVGGMKIDVDLAEHPGLPADFKTGAPFSDTWFGVPFRAYASWFLGLRI